MFCSKMNFLCLLSIMLMAIAVGHPAAQLSDEILSTRDLTSAESHRPDKILSRQARQIFNYGSDFNFGFSMFDRAQQIDNIFQIPIQTLTAVNNVVRNTRPAGQRRRDRLQQSLQNITATFNLRPDSIQAASTYLSNLRLPRFLTNAARVADLPVREEDESSYKI